MCTVKKKETHFFFKMLYLMLDSFPYCLIIELKRKLYNHVTISHMLKIG